jgi:hypothetical protein
VTNKDAIKTSPRLCSTKTAQNKPPHSIMEKLFFFYQKEKNHAIATALTTNTFSK